MPFIGNQPALAYTSFAVQHFTTSATTSYTLDYPVANENEIRLVINNVVQQPGSSYAYTASGTSLTLSAATTGTDTMYAVFLGKAVQTVNPPNGSVGLSQLSATGTKDSTTFLRGDNTFATVSSDYVLLATTDASNSASVSFDGYFSATYRNYKITISNLIVATDNTALRMRFRRSNADLADNYYVHILDAAYINSSSSSAGDQLNTGYNQAQITLNIGGVDNTDTLSSTNIDLLLYNPFGGTTKSICTFIGTNNNDGANHFYTFNGAGVYTNGTTALSGVSFLSSSGNLTSGNFKLYGIK